MEDINNSLTKIQTVDWKGLDGDPFYSNSENINSYLKIRKTGKYVSGYMNLISHYALNANNVYTFGELSDSIPIERVVQPVIIASGNAKLGDAKLSITTDGKISITPYTTISSTTNGYFQCNFNYISNG